ncbi:MAG: PAS domain S-box protein, partial [Sphingomonadaceae bacterium]|nr:PAS domain S-box protein [Sphingomonadaceae bacterium]
MWMMFGHCVIGHFVGAATIGALILSWWRPSRAPFNHGFVHFIAIFAVTAIATTLIFSDNGNGGWPTWQLLPFLVWTAIAFGVRGTAVMLAAIFFIALYETGVIWMPGGTASAHMSGHMWMVQQFLATKALTMLLLAAAVDELRSQAELKRRDLMLREGATGIFRWTFGSNQVECDDTLLRLLGTPPEHAPKRLQDLIAVLHPDDQLRILTTYEDCARNGTEISTTTRVMSKDGQSRTLNVRGRCVEHPTGNSAFETGAVVDITERSKLERRLIEAEHIYRAVFEQAGVGVACLSLKGTFLEVNERFCDVTSRPSDQLIGLNWVDIADNPDWEEAKSEFGELLNSGKGHFRVEKSYTDPQRGPVWVDMSVTLVHDARQNALFYLAIMQDITDGKTAEERAQLRANELETVLDAVPSVIWMAQDPDCANIIGNRFSADILRMTGPDGVESVSPSLKSENYKVYNSEGRELQENDLPVQRAARGETVRNFEERILFQDGQSIHLLGNASPSFNPAGQVRGAVAAFIDITERKRAEARERLLSREVDHRSKNVLAVVQAIIQLTEATNMKAYRRRITGRIQSLARTHSLLA